MLTIESVTEMYNLTKGKVTDLKESIERSMKAYNISLDDAIQLWLDDEGYTENDEQQALLKKQAPTLRGEKDKTKKVTRVRKENKEKQEIIEILFNALPYDNKTIRNNEKYIDFTLNETEYTINLVAHRPVKP